MRAWEFWCRDATKWRWHGSAWMSISGGRSLSRSFEALLWRLKPIFAVRTCSSRWEVASTSIPRFDLCAISLSKCLIPRACNQCKAAPTRLAGSPASLLSHFIAERLYFAPPPTAAAPGCCGFTFLPSLLYRILGGGARFRRPSLERTLVYHMLDRDFVSLELPKGSEYRSYIPNDLSVDGARDTVL